MDVCVLIAPNLILNHSMDVYIQFNAIADIYAMVDLDGHAGQPRPS
jgi:hypothetical protein